MNRPDMIKTLFGDTDSEHAVRQILGKTIAAIELVDDNLVITFEDSSKLKLWDRQGCCESRYMRTDDELSYYVGGRFLDIEPRDAPRQEGEFSSEVHDVQFLAVKTSKGEFVMSNHNEHNGQYGGFYIEAKVLPQ